MTLSEAARRTGRARAVLQKALRAGRLRGRYRPGPYDSMVWDISEQDLADWLATARPGRPAGRETLQERLDRLARSAGQKGE